MNVTVQNTAAVLRKLRLPNTSRSTAVDTKPVCTAPYRNDSSLKNIKAPYAAEAAAPSRILYTRTQRFRKICTQNKITPSIKKLIRNKLSMYIVTCITSVPKKFESEQRRAMLAVRVRSKSSSFLYSDT